MASKIFLYFTVLLSLGAVNVFALKCYGIFGSDECLDGQVCRWKKFFGTELRGCTPSLLVKVYNECIDEFSGKAFYCETDLCNYQCGPSNSSPAQPLFTVLGLVVGSYFGLKL